MTRDIFTPELRQSLQNSCEHKGTSKVSYAISFHYEQVNHETEPQIRLSVKFIQGEENVVIHPTLLRTQFTVIFKMYNLKRIFGYQVLHNFDENDIKQLMQQNHFSHQQIEKIIEYTTVKDLSKQLSTHIKGHPVKDITTIVEMVDEWVLGIIALYENPENIVPNQIQRIYSYFSKTSLESKDETIKEKINNYEYNAIKYIHHEHKGLFSIEQFFSKKLFEKHSIEEKQTNPICKRYLHKSVFVRSKNSIITWGGFANGVGITDDMLKFDLETKKITQTKTNAKGRIFHTLDYLPHLNKLVVFGGIERNQGISSEVLVSEMDFSWSNRSNENIPSLCCHSTAALFETLYIFGGFNGVEKKYSNKMYILNIPTLTVQVSKASGCPIERIGSAMSIVGDNIFIYGGQDINGNVLSDIYRYNTTQDLYYPITHEEQAINPKLCFANMFFMGNNLCLYGGWDGFEFNSSLFETGKDEIKWKIVKCVKNEGSNFDSYNTLCTAIPVSERSIYLLGGLSLPFCFVSIMDTFIKLTVGKDDLTMKGKYPSYRVMQHKRQVDGFSLSLTFLKWFKQQNPEECDVTILINIPNQVEQEIFYGQKLVLVRSPLLAKKILEQDGQEDSNKTKHGHHVVILLDNFPSNVENIRKSFNSVLEYLYSGCFSSRELASNDYSDIFKVACYLETPLLSQALDNTLRISEKVETKSLISSISDQLDHLFTPCETISNIDEFMSTLDDNPVPPGMVKIVVPISLDSTTYQSVLIHKFILTQRCKYFNAVFEMNFLEAHTRVAVIDQNTFRGLLSILHYVYTSMIVELDLSNAVEIFMSSFQFELNELLDASKLFIREHEFDVFTTIRLLEIFETVNDKVMQDYCKYNIAKRYDQVMKQDPSALDVLSRDIRIEINELRKSVLKQH